MLLSLLLASAVLGVVSLFRQNTLVPPALFSFFADACMGLTAGIACRIVLRRRHWLLMALTSAALATAALIALGWITAGQLGVGPWPHRTVTLHWLETYNFLIRVPFPSIPDRVDPLEIAHFAIAVDLSWVGLRAWSRRSRITSRSSAGVRRSQADHGLGQSSVSSSRLPVAVQSPPAPSRQPAARTRSGGRRHLNLRPPMRSLRLPAKRRGPVHAGSGVQLAVHEEHRCPYCLEPVKRGDARGTVECPICHTLHHKDCWDITGTCQVPHLNT
jgi:hypothetical protein